MNVQLLWGICHDCKIKHPIELVPGKPVDNALNDWWTKHEGHAIEYRREAPDLTLLSRIKSAFRVLNGKRLERRFLASAPWLCYGDNAADKLTYASSAAYTIDLHSLATDANLLAGRQSTTIDNTTNVYKDYLIAANKITTGTSPTGGQIEAWVYGSYDDTPTYPDTLTGSDANKTLTNTNIKASALYPWCIVPVTTSSNVGYPIRPTSLASLPGALGIPKFHGIFVVHSTGVNLNATAGNHVLSYMGVYETIA